MTTNNNFNRDRYDEISNELKGLTAEQKVALVHYMLGRMYTDIAENEKIYIKWRASVDYAKNGKKISY